MLIKHMGALIALAALSIVGIELSLVSSPASAAEGSCVRTQRGYRCLYGPFSVAEGENSFSFQAAAIPREGFITGARVAVVDASGSNVSRHHIHLHHSDWLDPTTTSVLCPNWAGSVIYMSGKERTKMVFPEGHGFHWKNTAPDETSEAASETGDPYWAFSTMLMGMHPGMEDEVYLRLNLLFKGMRADLQPVQTEFQSVTHCTNASTFDIEKGAGADGRYRRTLDFEWPVDARFVWGTGHMHDGGIKLSFRNVTRDQRVLLSRALYADGRWDLTGTTTWSSQRGLKASAGDLVRLKAVYDSTHQWDDVMGNLRITFTR